MDIDWISLKDVKKDLRKLGIKAEVDGLYFSGIHDVCWGTSVWITFEKEADINLYKLCGSYNTIHMKIK